LDATAAARRAPVAIGGIGGSGTRAVAICLDRLGFLMGQDLNESLDNLWFTLFFKQQDVLSISLSELAYRFGLFMRRMHGQHNFSDADIAYIRALAAQDRCQHDARWLSRRVSTFLTQPAHVAAGTKWGWKEPNTHLIVPRLLRLSPALRYVHVVRHGLDMATSPNQNQLRFWGPWLPDTAELGVTPRDSLKFWCRSQRAFLHARAHWPDRVFLLNFDQLCCNPEAVLLELLAFLEESVGTEKIGELAGTVVPPPSIGRFRKHDNSLFDTEDLEFVASLGFCVD
jgi:hypothetical protein